MPYYFTLGAGLIVSVAFLFSRAKGATVKNLFFKTASSLLFLLTMVFALIANPNATFFGAFVIMGGVLGLAGDIALDLKYIYKKDANQYLNAGFLFFLIGHIFYTAAIIWHNQFKWRWVAVCAAVSIVIGVGNVLSAKMMKVNFGKFKIIVFAYTAFLAMTTVTSVLAAFVTHSKTMIIFAIGAVLFLLSDVVLSFTYFGKGWDKPVHIFVNHMLYYAGQYLIAASILFLN